MPFKHKIRTRIDKPRILVIDDEVQLAELLRAVLESAGLEVAVIYDAADAQKAMQNFHPDIILSDVCMPEMRGDELLATLKEEQMKTPVIFLTGIDRTHISLDPEDENPYMILYKPVPHEVLIRSIENALRLIEERMINAELLRRLQEQDQRSVSDISALADELIDYAMNQINNKRTA
ncbi:MAG: response regulator [Oligoflexus sp.]